MADLIVTEELQDFLVAQGVVQRPPGDASLPVIWLDKRDGAPEPRPFTSTGSVDADGVKVTVTLRRSGTAALPVLTAWLEAPVVDVIVRAWKSPQGELVQRQIRNLLHEKKMLQIGDLQTEWIAVWRGAQPVAADETSYTTVQSFVIEARVKALAGLPYVP